MLWLRNKKNNFPLCPLIWKSVTFTDRWTEGQTNQKQYIFKAVDIYTLCIIFQVYNICYAAKQSFYHSKTIPKTSRWVHLFPKNYKNLDHNNMDLDFPQIVMGKTLP